MRNSRELAKQILSYLQEHPEAADTLEGIAFWWLHSQRIDETVNSIHQALQQLKAEGVVAEQQVPGGKTLYCLMGDTGKD